MGNKVIFKNLSKIKSIPTNHYCGRKKILISHGSCSSNLTQAAIGYLNAGEKTELHFHSTMEEFFFFEKGNVIVYTNGQILRCGEGDFLMIPKGENHSFEAISSAQFIYWGISI